MRRDAFAHVARNQTEARASKSFRHVTVADRVLGGQRFKKKSDLDRSGSGYGDQRAAGLAHG